MRDHVSFGAPWDAEFVSQLPPKKIAKIVLKGRQNKATNVEILDKLIHCGIEPLSAPSLLEAFDSGYKIGICALDSSGKLDANSTPEAEAVFNIAVGQGKEARHGPNPLYLIAKFALPWILATIVLSIAWYLALTVR